MFTCKCLKAILFDVVSSCYVTNTFDESLLDWWYINLQIQQCDWMTVVDRDQKFTTRQLPIRRHQTLWMVSVEILRYRCFLRCLQRSKASCFQASWPRDDGAKNPSDLLRTMALTQSNCTFKILHYTNILGLYIPIYSTCMPIYYAYISIY